MNFQNLKIYYNFDLIFFNYELFYESSFLFKQKYPSKIEEIFENNKFEIKHFKLFLNFIKNNDFISEELYEIIDICNYWKCDNLLTILQLKFFSLKDTILGQYSIGIMYLNGYSIKKNEKEAIKWLKLSAEKGDMKSQIKLGELFFFGGDQIPKNYQESYNWFELSSKNEYSISFYYLGLMNQYEYGIVKNNIDFMKYFEISAQNGNIKSLNQLKELSKEENYIAQYILGSIYENKECIFYNINKSIEYYKESLKNGYLNSLDKLIFFSDQNYSIAQYELGKIYENGYGIESNIEKSLFYYNLSFQNGDINCKRQYDRLTKTNFYYTQELKEFEVFISNYQINNEIPKKILNFIENQYIFFVENIYIFLRNFPFKYINLINLIINIFLYLKNQKLFKELLLIIGSKYTYFLIYQLHKIGFLLDDEIKKFSEDIINKAPKYKFQIYFPYLFPLIKRNYYNLIDFENLL